MELDCVRGLAMFLAMGWHLHAQSGFFLLDLALAPGRLVGWAGVDLFFVLSGFLVGRLILVELGQTGRFDLQRFVLRRVLRLWPVLYLYLAAQLIVGSKPAGSFFWQVMLHVQNYFPTPLAGLWSLAIEEHFYLLAGLAIPWAFRHLQPRQQVVGLAAVMVGSLALRIVAVQQGLGSHAIQWQSHFRADALACGMLLAVVSIHWPDTFQRLLRPKAALLAVAIALACAVAPLHRTALGDTVGYTMAMAGSAALLLAACGWKWPPSIDPLAHVMAFLGRCSYPIYIWHVALGNEATRLAARLGIDHPGVIVPLQYAAAITGGYMIAVLIERPTIWLRDRWIPASPRVDRQEPASGRLVEGERHGQPTLVPGPVDRQRSQRGRAQEDDHARKAA